MSVVSTITVTVPATTANLGPGFDCIGAALKLYNEFKFTRLEEGGLIIHVNGTEAERVQTDESNLLYQAFVKFYQHIEQTPPIVKIEIKLGVPLARGLGSSATAIVGGLVAANQLEGAPMSQSQVMELAIAMEGHPDNVVPALLGGCRLAATSGAGWEICDVPWHKDVVPVVAIPNFELSTSEARGVLPTEVSRADAIFNTAHLGLLLRGLETGNGQWLKTALQDKLHQPYRKALIPGYDALNIAAVSAGAYGMVISGAGPTLLALADQLHSKAVEAAMLAAWQEEGITAEVRSLSLDTQGAKSF
ncbi:homoserine kinase [Nostoc sp. 'Peltigera membranacea cyanobiont' 210A]|uniref:homoserine kinase n=1 Tax=Nostoc sp. 'Peltigera membranacea cyanobiont' 210A TaxID=2014529 RepID=UPI000B9552F7|nr:homoserine kinase [Nostoc sp. 'Peltigera membranacea cyanobiont' 210A]OYD92517.1 homoserine kinase [Nostoc sp. 'Peltigera membranacea cyanobiont' 210A]